MRDGVWVAWLLIGVSWVWSHVFVLPVLVLTALIARCRFTPRPIKRTCHEFVSWLTRPTEEELESD